MKSVKVSDLKARLSAYLSAVRKGESVTVCDRHTPIARLVPLEHDFQDLVIEDATRPAGDLKRLKPVRLRRPIDVVRLLRKDRDQR